MSNIIPLGSGARQPYVPPAVPVDPTAIPAEALPLPEASYEEPTPEPEVPAPAPEAPAAEVPTDTAPFDVSQFQEAFEGLKKQVSDRRAKLVQDVTGLQSEDEQLAAQIADWDARANAAATRRGEIAKALDAKLTSFHELDEATQHLQATDALLYPQPADATPAAQ